MLTKLLRRIKTKIFPNMKISRLKILIFLSSAYADCPAGWHYFPDECFNNQCYQPRCYQSFDKEKGWGLLRYKIYVFRNILYMLRNILYIIYMYICFWFFIDFLPFRFFIHFLIFTILVSILLFILGPRI